MSLRARYDSREDLLLAESMFEVRRKHGKSRSEAFGTRFPEVYDLYIRKCSSYGTTGIVRPRRAVESRLYHIRDAFRKRRLRRFFRGDDATCMKSYQLWSEILESDVFPAKQETGRDGGANYSHLQRGAYEEEGPPTHLDEPTALTHRQHSRPRHKENAKQLLDAFTEACNERSRIEKTSEETRRRQAQLVQDQRKWEKEMLSTLIEKSSSNDEDNFSAFLQSLKAMAKRDAELSRLREESAAIRMENDRENWEWEKDTYEDILRKYFDERDSC